MSSATAPRRRMSVPHPSSLALTSSSSSSSLSVFSSADMQHSSSSSQTTDSTSSPPDSPKPGSSTSGQPCVVARLMTLLELEPEDLGTPRVQQAAQAADPCEEDPDGGYESEREGPLQLGGTKIKNRPKILTRKRGASSAATAVGAAWTEGIAETTVRSRLHPLLLPSPRLNPLIHAADPSFTFEAPTRCIQQQ